MKLPLATAVLPSVCQNALASTSSAVTLPSTILPEFTELPPSFSSETAPRPILVAVTAPASSLSSVTAPAASWSSPMAPLVTPAARRA